MTRIISYIILLALLAGSGCGQIKPVKYNSPEQAAKLLEQGAALAEKGDFGGAGDLFDKAVRLADQKSESSLYLQACIRLAECYKAMGYHTRALTLFKEALPIFEQSTDSYTNALFLSAVADIYFTLGRTEEMGGYMFEAINEARRAGNPHVLSSVLNDLGNGLAWTGDFENALAAHTNDSRGSTQ